MPMTMTARMTGQPCDGIDLKPTTTVPATTVLTAPAPAATDPTATAPTTTVPTATAGTAPKAIRFAPARSFARGGAVGAGWTSHRIPPRDRRV